MKKILLAATVALTAGVLSACNTTQLGGGSSMVTGSAGAAGEQNAASQLVKCQRPIGTAALVEEQSPGLAQAGLSSPVPLMRLIMAQSRCFQVVDRGQAATIMAQERELMAQGQLQRGSNLGGGQMMAADYLITPNVAFQDENSGGGGALLGAFLPGVAGAVASGIRWENKEAQVTLFLTNVRTGVQEAVSEGSAKKTDLGGGLLGVAGLVGGGLGAYESTDIGKITAAAFLDAHNKLVNQMVAMNPGLASALAPTATGTPSEVKGYATTTGLNLRSAPGGAVITTMPQGAAVYPTGNNQGDWWEVRYDTLVGWTSQQYLRPVN